MNKRWDIFKVRDFVLANSDSKLLSTEYLGYSTKLEFECKCGNTYKRTWHKFSSQKQRQCVPCAKKQPHKPLGEFLSEVYMLVGEEYEFKEYKGAHNKVDVKHTKCGFEYKVTPNHFINTGRRCPLCNGGVGFSEEEFKERLAILYNGEIELVGSFTKMHTSTVFRNTIYDVTFSAYPTNVIQGYALGRKISNGEFAIKVFLDDINIDYEFQYIFPELRKRPFDFYIPSKNIAIEYDGEQHFRPVEHFGGLEKLKRQQESDEIKNQHCKNNKINLIRIPYWKIDEIENILKDAIL